MSIERNDKVAIRPARVEDAPVLARLVNYAGEGLPLYLWDKMAPEGKGPWEVGEQRAAREEGSFFPTGTPRSSNSTAMLPAP
ncbi:hypothetical protein QW131_06505 [Roseibium salinum]|nr:hypothetical protein [Roseibium salinum]